MSDQQNAPDTGQGVTQNPQGTTEQSEPFFSYKYADGREEVYKSKDELEKAYRDSFLRQSDYTRKTQEVAQTRKQIEDERKKFAEEQQQFTKMRQQYDEWDRLLKSRPDLYSQLERVASGPPDPSSIFDRSKGYVDEKYTSLEAQLKDMKESMEKDRTQKELDATFAEFRQKYEDFDEGPIMERLEMLANGETKPLIDALYWAHKGQMTPQMEAQLEEKIAGNLEKKKQAKMIPTKGSSSSPSKRTFKTLDEARKAAFEDAGVEPG